MGKRYPEHNPTGIPSSPGCRRSHRHHHNSNTQSLWVKLGGGEHDPQKPDTQGRSQLSSGGTLLSSEQREGEKSTARQADVEP